MAQKILVIDDDESLRRVLEYTLQEEGYEVFTAASGEEGLALFEERQPALVITDMKMPGLNGFQVLKEVKERSAEALVIIVTAFGEVDAAVKAMKLGAYDFITKPLSRDELKLTVKKALQLLGLTEENRQLREKLSGRDDLKNLVGMSPKMERLFASVRKVADTEATVLITGESGTGKELVARAIHSLSSRKSAPFIAINCAAIPRDLLESELFGHTKGAFTGAVKDRVGKFQLADRGTLFLDEVGDLPIELQPKLLRALQERIVEPLGGGKAQKIDVRVVAATNQDLEGAIADGSFREDLYYRLSVIPVHLPPLRERKEDISLLVRHFINKLGQANVTFTKGTLDVLAMYSWPGNVRELENTVERLLIMRRGDEIGPDDLPGKILDERANKKRMIFVLPDEGYPLEQLEKEVVEESLTRNNWNQTAAARFLGIPRHVLVYRMEKYGIVTPDRRL
ncbi:MAG: sigma-54-dependent transcriptional regulator [Desulfobulbaceae bacterium]